MSCTLYAGGVVFALRLVGVTTGVYACHPAYSCTYYRPVGYLLDLLVLPAL